MASYLVTGASRGLGLALVQQLAARPATEVASIVATARQPRELPSLVESSRGRIAYVPLDTTSASSVAEAVERIQRTHGALDVLINNAGVGSYTRGGVTEMYDPPDGRQSQTNSIQGCRQPHSRDEHKHHGDTSSDASLPTSATTGNPQDDSQHVCHPDPRLYPNPANQPTSSTTMASLDRAKTYNDMPVPTYRISKTALNMMTVQYAHALADESFTCFAVSPGVRPSIILPYTKLTATVAPDGSRRIPRRPFRRARCRRRLGYCPRGESRAEWEIS